MITIKGVQEMLKMASGGDPKSFNDFTRIVIRGKRLSSATVSKRIGDLIRVEVLKEVITRSKAGRRVIAYSTTEKGKRVIRLVEELDEMLTLKKR